MPMLKAPEFIHFTAPTLTKDEKGTKHFKPRKPWKDKSKEQYEEMCRPDDKVFCVLTGEINNITIFDFDDENAYWDCIKKYPHLKDCYTIKTSKGFHIYTKYNPGYKTTTNQNVMIDVRNDAALAFGAGTKTEFGTEYSVYNNGSLDIEAPQELYDYIKPPCKKDAKKKTKTEKNKEGYVAAPLGVPCEPTETELNHAIIENISIQYIRNYNDWIKIVWAIRNLYGNSGKEFGRTISKKALNYSDEGFENVWKSNKEDTLGMGTLKWYSRKGNETNYFKIIAEHNNIPDCLTESSDIIIGKQILDLIADDIVYQEDEFYVWYNNRWIFDMNGNVFKKAAGEALNKYFTSLKDIYEFKLVGLNPESEEYKYWCKMIRDIKKLINKIHSVSCLTNYFAAIKVLLSGSDKIIQFDMKANFFCFNNKCYDLDKKNWVETSKYDYILTKTGYDYVEPSKEQKEKIKILMEQIFPDPEVRKSYMSVLRQGLVGRPTEKFIIANGSGRNGKGFTNELFMSLVGNYGYDMNISTLTETFKGGSNPEIANLHKKRFLVATEPSDSVSLNLGNIKKITGGDEINARMNYSNRTKTILHCTLILECNKKPNIDGRIDESVLQRFMDYGFVSHYSDDPKVYNNPDLKNVYMKDTSLKTPTFKEDHRIALFHYILSLEGIDSIYHPDIIRERTRAYLDDKDEFSNWFFDKYEQSDNTADIIRAADVFETFTTGIVYQNMTRRDKRLYNKKQFNQILKDNMNTKLYYREKVVKNKIEIVLIGFKKKSGENNDCLVDEEDLY